MIHQNYLLQINYFLLVSQDIAFNTEKSNTSTFPLEEIINPISFLDTNDKEFLII